MRPADQITGNSAHIALSCLWSQRGGKVRKKGLRGTPQGAAYGELRFEDCRCLDDLGCVAFLLRQFSVSVV
jgi:hypothetical protein